MMSFSEAYDYARTVLQTQQFSSSPQDSVVNRTDLLKLLEINGPNPTYADSLDQLRAKLLQEPVGKRGEAVVDGCRSPGGGGSLQERAATVKLLWHLYRSRKRGAQDVWVYSPPRDFKTWVYSEVAGAEDFCKKQLEKTDEIYTTHDRGVMCDALAHALASVQKTGAGLSSGDPSVLAAVAAWFSDEDSTPQEVQAAAKTLSVGCQKIAGVLNSNSLVFSDEPINRTAGGWNDFGFVRPAERMHAVYIQGAFLRAGATSRLWLCAQTLLHEVSHRAVGTDDIRYDQEGLKPSKTTRLSAANALRNADSWGYFCLDAVGMLAPSDRARILKITA